MVKREKIVVRFTTKDVVRRLFSFFSPLLCRGCGRKGEILCSCCKNYIVSGLRPKKIQEDDRGTFKKAEYIGFRDEILGELVEEYKYGSVAEIGPEIAEIVYRIYVSRLSPEKEYIFAPMPTSKSHIRERGFDHMDEILTELARLSRRGGGNIKKERILERAKNTVQVGANEETRRRQAKEAVKVCRSFLEGGRLKKQIREKTIVVVDDVWTTGASLTEAGKMIKKAGAREVFALAITKNRQGLSPVIYSGEVETISRQCQKQNQQSRKKESQSQDQSKRKG